MQIALKTLTALACVAAVFSILTAADSPHQRAISSVDVPGTFQTIRQLDRDEVRVELGLSPAQVTHLNKYRFHHHSLANSLKSERELTPEEAAAQKLRLKRDLWELEQQTVGTLTPPQRRRLAEIVLQDSIRARNVHGGLVHPKMVSRLKLTPEQMKLVAAKETDAQARLDKRLEELRAERVKAMDSAREEVLSTLTPEQRRLYDELTGKPFYPN